MHCAFTAGCCHVAVLAVRGQGGGVAGFLAFQLSNFSTSRLLDLLAYWFVGLLALCLVVGAARVWVQRSPDAYLREGVHQGC